MTHDADGRVVYSSTAGDWRGMMMKNNKNNFNWHDVPKISKNVEEGGG